MISRSPNLFEIEEGEAATAPMPASGEPVGLRLIIQSSLAAAAAATQQGQPPMAVLTRSAVRFPAASASKRQESSCGPRSFVGLEFLKCCLRCLKKIDADMDVFVYKGEHAFCSAECRCQQIAKEERREIEMLVRKRRDAFHRRRAGAAQGSIGGPDRRHARANLKFLLAT